MLLRVYHVYNLYQLKLLTSYLSLDSSLIVRNESAITQVSVCVCVCVCVWCLWILSRINVPKVWRVSRSVSVGFRAQGSRSRV